MFNLISHHLKQWDIINILILIENLFFFSATICIIISQKILNELLTRYGNDTACNQSDTLNILRTNLLTWLTKTRLEVFKNATIE